MTWHETCDDFNSRIEASAKDANFNDTIFLLTQPDADTASGDKVSANKAILALMSPVFYAQFYGPLATSNDGPIEIVDGTAKGFKQLINFICNPKSFQIEEGGDVTEVFDISYFAHKYQIGSLVSLCRQTLADFSMWDNYVPMLNWANSSERGLELKETFPAEHALLVHNCWEFITTSSHHFRSIFPNGTLKEGQDLPEEDLMMEILRRRPGCIEEEFALSVAIDYYSKLLDKGQKVGKKQKRIELDNETEWNQKIDKIKTVVKLEKVRPKCLADIYEKFYHRIPDIIGKITNEISTSWKNKDNFPSYSYYLDLDSLFEIPVFPIDSGNTDDYIHDEKIKIKFKTSQNAVLHLDESKVLRCPCSDGDCCVGDSITFQNEDFKEQVSSVRDSYFYVKGNKEATLTYEKKCKRGCEDSELHLMKLNTTSLSKGNFQVDILEVNEEPVTSSCYTFIENLFFTPI